MGIAIPNIIHERIKNLEWMHVLFKTAKGLGIIFVGLVTLTIWIEFTGHNNVNSHTENLKTFQGKINWDGITDKTAFQKIKNVERQTISLRPAPYSDLYEETGLGYIPKVSRSGLTPFDAYKRPLQSADDISDKPKIALGMMDFCLSKQYTDLSILLLPGPVSFVVTPYCNDIDAHVKKAREKGHEVWLTLPMEQKEYPLDDAGPDVLLTSSSEEKNLRRVERILGKTAGYVGLVAKQEAIFHHSKDDFLRIIEVIYGKGLGFMDASTQAPTYLERLSGSYDAPYLANDIWVDDVATRQAIQSRFEQLELMAESDGYVTALFNPYPLSINMVSEWIKSLTDRGFVIVPLSAGTQF